MARLSTHEQLIQHLRVQDVEAGVADRVYGHGVGNVRMTMYGDHLPLPDFGDQPEALLRIALDGRGRGEMRREIHVRGHRTGELTWEFRGAPAGTFLMDADIGPSTTESVSVRVLNGATVDVQARLLDTSGVRLLAIDGSTGFPITDVLFVVREESDDLTKPPVYGQRLRDWQVRPEVVPLRPGIYEVDALRSGYGTVREKQVVVNSGRLTEVTLRMVRQ